MYCNSEQFVNDCRYGRHEALEVNFREKIWLKERFLGAHSAFASFAFHSTRSCFTSYSCHVGNFVGSYRVYGIVCMFTEVARTETAKGRKNSVGSEGCGFATKND